MIEFIKNKKNLAQYYGISRPTLDLRIKTGEIVLNQVPKDFKYYIINNN